jgi:hypothetical protein
MTNGKKFQAMEPKFRNPQLSSACLTAAPAIDTIAAIAEQYGVVVHPPAGVRNERCHDGARARGYLMSGLGTQLGPGRLEAFAPQKHCSFLRQSVI